MGKGVRWGAIVYVLLIGAASLALTTLLHFPHGPEHWSSDLRTAFLSERPASQDGRIALIYVTEKTLENHPYLSPTDRQLLADLVKAVDAAGPKAIGFDFIVDRPTERAKDEALIAALASARAPVVVGAIDESGPAGRRSFQAEFLARVRRDVGHLYFDERRNMLVISDHVVRQMARRPDDIPYRKSFAEVLADKAGPYEQPKSRYIAWLLPPKDGTETFLSLSAEQVLARGPQQLPLQELLKDRIVLIGGNFGERDQHLTPLSVISGMRYPGLYIHGQILAQLISNRSLTTVPVPLQLVAVVLAAWFGFWIASRARNYLIIELASVVLLIAAGIVAFAYANLILPYTGVLMALLAGIAGGRYGKRIQA